LQIFAPVRQHFLRLMTAYIDAADILRTTARLDEAQLMLAEAATLFPDHSMLWRAAGTLIEARNDWAAAVTHWAEMGRRFPEAADQPARMHGALLRRAEIDPSNSHYDFSSVAWAFV
jgi:hypothetical protein